MILTTQNIGGEAVNVSEQFKEGQWYENQVMLETNTTKKKNIEMTRVPT